MSSVVSSSQYGTYTSSHESSEMSSHGDREDFPCSPEGLVIMQNRIETMQRENELFIEYARRNGKELVQPNQISESNTRMRARMHKRRKVPQLPTNRKLEMATQVIEQIESDIKSEERRGENEIAKKRAILAQIALHEKDIDKEQLQFIREIMEESQHEKVGYIIGEKLVKWYDDSTKSKEAKIEKLRLKQASLKSQISRTKARLQQKLELGEKLQQVDYDQLQIDNEEFTEVIEKLAAELAKLQKISSSAVSKLSNARNTLAEQEKECFAMEQSIDQKVKAIAKYEREAQEVEEDHIKFKANNEELITKKSEYRVPEVTDYIDKKAKIYELSKVIKDWERKVQLAEMNVKKLRKEFEEAEKRDQAMRH